VFRFEKQLQVSPPGETVVKRRVKRHYFTKIDRGQRSPHSTAKLPRRIATLTSQKSTGAGVYLIPQLNCLAAA
jgi:hypothetical protein